MMFFSTVLYSAEPAINRTCLNISEVAMVSHESGSFTDSEQEDSFNDNVVHKLEIKHVDQTL